VLDDDIEVSSVSEPSSGTTDVKESSKGAEMDEYKDKSSEELKNMLQTALDEEKYEMASKIRDELNQRKKS
jgi:protein-arginine kinase activator protein McsA